MATCHQWPRSATTCGFVGTGARSIGKRSAHSPSPAMREVCSRRRGTSRSGRPRAASPGTFSPSRSGGPSVCSCSSTAPSPRSSRHRTTSFATPPCSGRPRLDEVAQRVLPARVLRPRLAELRDLPVQPHPSPPLHALLGRGPGEGDAGVPVAAAPLPAAGLHGERHRRIPHAGGDSRAEELRPDCAEPRRRAVQPLGSGALRRVPRRANEGGALGAARAAPARGLDFRLRGHRAADSGCSRFGFDLLRGLAPVLRRSDAALRSAKRRRRTSGSAPEPSPSIR